MISIKHDPTSAIVSPSPVMIGEVASQALVGEVDAALLRVTSVSFREGARNMPHRHSCDQVLVITDGIGVIVTKYETREVSNGDVVVIPAGELHWHGSAARSFNDPPVHRHPARDHLRSGRR